MLRINLDKLLQGTNEKNPHTLANRIGLQGHGIYKYADPEKVSGLRLETLSNMVSAIAEERGVSPLEVTFGDIFDWK